MTLTDPIPVYLAVDNLEAHLVCSILNSVGLEAAALEDVTALTFPQWLQPRVYINRSDLARAKPILEEYMLSRDERQRMHESGPPVEVRCAECGEVSSFPAAQRGTVQVCPNCHAYVDVGEVIPFEGWEEPPAENETGAEPKSD